MKTNPGNSFKVIMENQAVVDEIIDKEFDKLGIDQDEKAEKSRKEADSEENELKLDENESAEGEEEESEAEDDILSDSVLAERKLELAQLKEEGNKSFRSGDFKKAIELYSECLRKCPRTMSTDRAVLYSNRAAAELKADEDKAAIVSATRAIKYNPDFFKGYLRRARAYEKDENKLDECLEDFKKVISLEPGLKEAHTAIPEVQKRIEVRNEKMKTEMLDKLKDLGNMVLKPFGLSTKNFQMVQDPNSGGYSINFKQS